MVKILFVEDNPELLQSAALVLEEEGYSVALAQDGRAALDLLDADPALPDLIVSDIAMPRMDGYEFFQAVRARPDMRAIPFIFLTARGARQDIQKGKRIGADDYLVKPFDAVDFLIAIENKLRRTTEIRQDAESQMIPVRQALVHMLAHELRTPLTYITGAFALLDEELSRKESTFSVDDVSISLDLIRNGTRRLNHMAEQMIIFTQLESGQAQQSMERTAEMVDMGYLVTTTIASLQAEAAQHDLTLTYDAHTPETAEVFGIPEMLQFALNEVYNNALFFAPAGSVIKTTLCSEKGRIDIAVCDEGPGILPEDLEKVWEPMYQSEREKYEQQGAGMGLAIVRHVCELHSGEATLESTLGQGTTVTMRLPITRRP